MEKRLIIAVALSFLILMGFQVFGPKKADRTPSGSETPVSVPTEQGGGPVEDETQPAYDQPVSLEEQAVEAGEDISVQTGKFDLTFSDAGGSLKKLYIIREDQGKENELLLDQKRASENLFVINSPSIKGLDTRKYKFNKYGRELEFKLQESGKVEVIKSYKINKSFNTIEIQIAIKNLSNNTLGFSYNMNGPAGLVKASEVAGRSYLQADTLIGEKIWKVKSTKTQQERNGDIIWTGLKNRYFTMILKPIDPLRAVTVDQTADKNLAINTNSRQFSLAPGETTTDRYLFYAGPLDEKQLADLGYGMERIVDYGFFGVVSKTLLRVLRFFHSWTHNWGLAIILLTLMINLILFPLTMKSFQSMHQMKKIQPHMQKLKELHKDNPQKLNKEMMELYKKYNVNPLGGCLPLILQMPIFISLYQGLMRSIELKGSSFLWIKDLSSPDAVPIPFTLPLIGNSINILPLLMVGMMVLQQKISQGITGGAVTPEQAQQQKMMMAIFPLFFGFLFYNMPSGLVLYWLTNTILMTTEQTFIRKKMDGGE